MPRTIDRDARKAQLAEAVWQVILERGVAAVSVRTVADRAGVVVGSLRHVFPTRAELLEFSAELMVRRAAERIGATPRTGGPQQFALAIVKHLLPLAPDSRAELEVNIALIAETPALPGLAAIRNHVYEQVGEACLQIVELLRGRRRNTALVREARRLHAIIDGLAIHLLHEPADADPYWALDIVRRELARIASGGP